MQPAYHSSTNASGFPEICGCPVLPLKSRGRGPAPSLDPSDPSEDIIDEALYFFRPNILFRSFEPQGGADRLLVYLSLFIAQCLKKVGGKSRADATRELNTLASGQHLIPGDSAWPLGTLLPAPKGPQEQESLRAYFRQLREALVPRLLDKLYANPEGAPDLPNKHWMMFSKRKFMGKEFA